MSLTLRINVSDLATPRLARLEEALRDSAALNRYVADAALALTEKAFVRNAAVPNKNAWPSTGFWTRMLSGTTATADADAATVRMPGEVAQRFFGGTITPKSGKSFLAIPARMEANGKSPLQFDDLHFVPTGPDRGMLVQNDKTVKAKGARARKDGSFKTEEVGGGVFFWLVKSVIQSADPSVLPDEADYLESALGGINTYLKRSAA